MIRTFSVENYLSIKERQTLSFLSKSKSEYLSYKITDSVYLNKIGIFFGANASGKSNIFQALNNVFELLVDSKSRKELQVNSNPPFALRKEDPIVLQVSFYAKISDQWVRFDYSIEYKSDRILKEKMYYYPQKVKALFYERTYVDENKQANIKFGASLKLHKSTKKIFLENTLNNHTVLSTIQKQAWEEDVKPMSDLYTWVRKYIKSTNTTDIQTSVELLKATDKDLNKKAFFLKMLRLADFNIFDYKVKKSEENERYKIVAKVLDDSEIKGNVKDELLNSIFQTIEFLNYAGENEFNLPIEYQSQGTLHFLETIDYLYTLLKQGGVALIDELNEALHYDLLVYYIHVYLMQSEAAQLIFTCHDRSLLEEDIFNDNRDTLWIVEKNKETASSEFTRVDTYGLSKKDSLYNAYKTGRLGGRPQTGSIVINYE